jgi:hypothetical protein
MYFKLVALGVYNDTAKAFVWKQQGTLIDFSKSYNNPYPGKGKEVLAFLDCPVSWYTCKAQFGAVSNIDKATPTRIYCTRACESYAIDASGGGGEKGGKVQKIVT